MYKVLTGTVTESASNEVLEAALNSAAEYVKAGGSAGKIAVVTSDDDTQAVTVVFGNWVYLAKEE